MLLYSKKILICGGDKRQKYLYDLFKKDGFNIDLFGMDIYNSVESPMFNKYDIIIFPVPVSRDRTTLNAPLEQKSISLKSIFPYISSSQTVLGGMVDNIDCQIIDYFTSEKLTMQNALLTAEGAINIAMNNIEISINGSKCLILGYGRIGKLLGDKLNKLGAKVWISARNQKDISLAKAYGLNSIHLNNVVDKLKDFDLIFNTIPLQIIDSEYLCNTRQDVVIIDLASKPYGFDSQSCKQLNRKLITASGLPGKYSPVTASKILKESIMDILTELEATK